MASRSIVPFKKENIPLPISATRLCPSCQASHTVQYLQRLRKTTFYFFFFLTKPQLRLKSDFMLPWSYYCPVAFNDIQFYHRRRVCQYWGSMLHIGDATNSTKTEETHHLSKNIQLHRERSFNRSDFFIWSIFFNHFSRLSWDLKKH